MKVILQNFLKFAYICLTACPKNTFKGGSNAVRTCTPCPANSHTATEGSSQIIQCQCDSGYRRDGNTCKGKISK